MACNKFEYTPKNTKHIFREYDISLYNDTLISESSIRYGPATLRWKYKQIIYFLFILKEQIAASKFRYIFFRVYSLCKKYDTYALQ